MAEKQLVVAIKLGNLRLEIVSGVYITYYFMAVRQIRLQMLATEVFKTSSASDVFLFPPEAQVQHGLPETAQVATASSCFG